MSKANYQTAALFILLLNLGTFLSSVSAHTPPPPPRTCPFNAVKLNACVDLLGGLVKVDIGEAKKKCCPLLEGLADLDAEVCLCTAIKANVLGVINLVVPLAVDVLVGCGKDASGFQCSK
ncbi:Bifunctional inhibitor/lipid-transfer protein/seed storage 2S albumin superfamily protein [Melia azedarach]|uniref:Bifunctional inhibitor/lipid-transfer protein/seed storage 2S albumin superfamily protein n=1 Tax=Melia azedarach TaxID=155640 RepID=A0ACC1X3F1_MELAZ|nr:Bifunctional inhibitor/lipid-transfer protein/seed storage 2S albumin superfamily protein [Melia azedarach]